MLLRRGAVVVGVVGTRGYCMTPQWHVNYGHLHERTSAQRGMQSSALMLLSPLAGAMVHPLPYLAPHSLLSRTLVPRMMTDDRTRIVRLEANLAELESLGCGDDVLGPLRKELQSLKIADLEAELMALKAGLSSPESPPSPVSAPASVPPPPPPPPPPSASPSAMSTDAQATIMRLGELSFEIETAMDAMRSGGATDDDALMGMQALRAERKRLFVQLRGCDEAVYSQTLSMLQASYSIPEFDLPPATTVVQRPPSAPAQPPPAPTSPQDADDDTNVVVIGGKRYVLKTPPPAPPTAPPLASPTAPPTAAPATSSPRFTAPSRLAPPSRPPSLFGGLPFRMPFEKRELTAEEKAAAADAARAREAATAKAAADAAKAAAERKVQMERDAKINAAKARVDNAQQDLEFAVRRVRARRELATLEDLEMAIDKAAVEGIVTAEALAEAREVFRDLAATSGLTRTLDERRKNRPPPAAPAPPPPAASAPPPSAPPAPLPPPRVEAVPATAVSTEARAPQKVVEVKTPAELREEAQAQGAAAEAAAAARRAATMAAEMDACKKEIMSSLQLPADDQRLMLRKLQVKWHPDNFPGDDPATVEAREFAGMVVRIANEAAMKAKRVRNKQNRTKRRSEAYDALQAAMPSVFRMGKADAPTLRAAIEVAKEAGVSQVHIVEAETALRKMEAKM